MTRNLNMFTLIAMGTGVAWVYSIVATVAPGAFPTAFRSPEGAVAVYFEAAAVITVLVLLGQVLELRAREQTSAEQFERCSISHQKPPARSKLMAPKKKCRSISHRWRSLASSARRKGPGRWRRA